MFKSATFLLKIVIIAIGAIILFMAVMLFPEILRSASRVAEIAGEQGFPLLAYVHISFIIGLYGATIPFFIALYQTLKLLKYIEQKKSFSALSVRTLSNIKKCAITICGLYMVGVMPMIYCLAELDDAPGLILVGFVIGLSPFIIAAFAGVLQTLLSEAIEMKSENDLTI